MNLHFVCTGNVFRSRLAESYGRYLLKNHPQFHLTSSGVNAINAQDGPIAWYALKIVDDNDLIPYISQMWIQTSHELLANQDKVVFMQPYHLAQAKSHYGYTQDNYLVWDIADITPEMTDDEIIDFSQIQYNLIKQKVEELVNQLLIG